MRRRGVSLLELLVVVSLLGILSSMVMIRFGRSMQANVGAQGDARRLALDLLTMQRSTITSGDHCGVVFTSSGGKITGYQVVTGLEESGGAYVVDGGTTQLDSPRTFQTDVEVTVSHSIMGYSFEGQAGGAYNIVLSGPQREYTLTVIPVTGAVLSSDRFK